MTKKKQGRYILIVAITLILVITIFTLLKTQNKTMYKLNENKVSREYLIELKEVGSFKVFTNNQETEDDEKFFGIYLNKSGELLGDGSKRPIDDSEKIANIFYSEEESVWNSFENTVKESCSNFKNETIDSITHIQGDCDDVNYYGYKLESGKFLGFSIPGNKNELEKVLNTFK